MLKCKQALLSQNCGKRIDRGGGEEDIFEGVADRSVLLTLMKERLKKNDTRHISIP